MAISRREAAILAGGLVLGLAGAWALFARGDGAAPASPVAAKADTARSAAAPAAGPARVASADLCSFDRVVAPSGEGDGQLRLEAELAGKGASDVRDLLVKGKEASASGHPRDAETAFMMACRAAGKLAGEDAILLADAMYRLGTHYAAVEGSAPEGKRGELRERAKSLYATSLQAYRAKYGDTHERTRFAEKGLAAMGGSAGDAKMVAAPKPQPAPAAPVPAAPVAEVKKPAPLPPPVVAEAPKPPPAVVTAPKLPPPVVAAAPKPAPVAPKPASVAPAPAPAPTQVVRAPAVVQAPVQVAKTPATVAPAAPAPAPVAANTRRARPSFDCDRARSTTEKIICADEDLARQDRELGRLHARAKEAAPDARDFQRRSDAEWSRREATCTDRECLQRWYSQRRAELSTEAVAPRREAIAVREPVVAPRPQPARVEPARVESARPVQRAIVATEPAVGQATGDAGDVSQ